MVLPAVFADAAARTRDLAGLTGLGVGGRPEFWFEPGSGSEAAAIVARCRREGIALRVLGGGFNLLPRDGTLAGAVLSTRRLVGLQVEDGSVLAGAGLPFPRLVREAVHLGIPALPGCPGIPGTVGGVVAMNAGGRFGTVGDALLEVSGVDEDGKPFRRAVAPSDLGYRRTAFEGTVLLSARFRRDPTLEVAAQRRLLDEALRWKQATQPLSARSVGCIFKNPSGPGTSPSAGRLIEEAGLKGRRVGDAEVSPIHANFIVNSGHATAGDVFALIDLVRGAVLARHGFPLDLEVRVWS